MKHLIFILLYSVSINLTAQTSENLYHYCKLWGLLKYYTPEAGRGKVNVDELFLATWPAFKQCKNQKDFDAFLQTTILPKFPSMNKVASQMNIQVFNNFMDTSEYRVLVDFNWVKDDYLSSEVQAKLIGGLNTYKGVKKKWMKTSWGYTQHKEENIALLPNSDSIAFRTLTLFKYWNWVEYFFAYKNLMDTNWDQDLKDGLTSLGDHLGFYLKMKNLSAKLQDEHSAFGGRNFIKYSTMFPIYFKKVDGVHRVISTDYVSVIGYHFENKKNKTILNIGDTLVSINGMKVEVWDSVVSSFISFSKPLDQIRFKDIFAYYYSSYPVYMQPKELIVTVKKMGVYISDTIRGDGSVWDSLYRDEPRFDRKKYENKHADIGFMSMVNLEDANARTLKKHFKEHEQKKVIIIDQTFQTMMNNYLAPFFQSKPRKVARAFSPMPTFPGVYKLVDFNLYYFSTSTIDFIYKAFFPNTKHFISPKLKPYKGTVVLIVDDGYSSMETQIMLLQTYCEKLVIVGQETPGTNGNICRLGLPLNTSAKITGTIFEYANGKQFQKKGVIPDHIINIPFEVEKQGEVAKRTYVVNKAFDIAEQIIEPTNITQK